MRRVLARVDLRNLSWHSVRECHTCANTFQTYAPLQVPPGSVATLACRFRAKREQLSSVQGLVTERQGQNQGQNLAVTVLCVPY